MKAVALVLAFTVSVGCAACSQYVDRKETVFLGAGDAVQTNMMAHVIDPWPPGVGNTKLSYNGERMQKAVERHRLGAVTDPGCAKAPPSGEGPSPATSGGTPCSQPTAPPPQPPASR